jgi:hypothetical protein
LISKKALSILGGLAVAVGFTGFIIRVISKVTEGQGVEYYFTGEGVKFSYIGVLTVIVIIPVILVLSYLYRIYYKKKQQDLKSNFIARRKMKRKYKL